MKYIIIFVLILSFITASAGVLFKYETIMGENKAYSTLIFEGNNYRFDFNESSIIINNDEQLLYIFNNNLKEYKVLPLKAIDNLVNSILSINKDTIKDQYSVKNDTLKENRELCTIYNNKNKVAIITINKNYEIENIDEKIIFLNNILTNIIGNNMFDFHYIGKGIPEKIILYDKNSIVSKTVLYKTKTGDYKDSFSIPENYKKE